MGTLRPVVGYASPAISALLFLLQQAISGNSQEALNSLLQSAPSFVPSGR